MEAPVPAKGEPDFAVLLCRYKRRSGLTQEALAERAGLSAASVSLLEHGITLAPLAASRMKPGDATPSYFLGLAARTI